MAHEHPRRRGSSRKGAGPLCRIGIRYLVCHACRSGRWVNQAMPARTRGRGCVSHPRQDATRRPQEPLPGARLRRAIRAPALRLCPLGLPACRRGRKPGPHARQRVRIAPTPRRDSPTAGAPAGSTPAAGDSRTCTAALPARFARVPTWAETRPARAAGGAYRTRAKTRLADRRSALRRSGPSGRQPLPWAASWSGRSASSPRPPTTPRP